MKMINKLRGKLVVSLLMMFVTVIVFGMSACSINGVKNDDETLIVGFDAEFPPYGYMNEDGEYEGFDLDLAKEVCDRNEWTLVKQPIEWNSKDMELKSNSIDCIWNGFTMNGREDEYTWTSAYVNNSQVVVVKADSGITRLAELADKIVAVQTDSSALAAFTSENATKENKELMKNFKSLEQIGDYNTAFLNLESGSIDAICMDVGVAIYEIEKRGVDFILLDEVVSNEQYGIGFRLGNTSLRNKVEQTLQAMNSDGSLEKIAKKWGLEEWICIGEEGSDAVMKNEKVVVDDESTIDKIISITKQLSSGMLSTFAIFILTVIFSMPLGLLLTFVRMSKSKVLSSLAKFYISIMRGTPLMLQLLVVFFGPYYLLGIKLPYSYRFYAVIIGFSLNYAAYFAEIYRAGIESIPKGQREAAQVLGYSRTQTFVKIIFPQMIKAVMPPVTNEIITLVKDTSLAFALAYTEMFTLAKQITASSASIIPLFVAGLFYYIFNFIVAWIMAALEKKMQYYSN